MPSSLPELILPIKLEKSEERLTSLGGLVVLEEMAQALKVWQRVDESLEAPGSGRGYRPSQFVQPLVWMLHAGGRRLEDLRELRAEQEVLENLGLGAVPDAGTVGDWLRRQGERGVAGMERVNRELIQGPLVQEGEELTLDVDATEIEAEKQEAQWTYHHVQGYMPLVAIARLLLKAPDIVILDEATAHLDSESEAAIQRAFETALHGRTSIVIAHRLSTILKAQQILVVNEGRIVERGTHTELLERHGLYAELYQRPFASLA